MQEPGTSPPTRASANLTGQRGSGEIDGKNLIAGSALDYVLK